MQETLLLAEFLAGADFGSLPPTVVREAKRSLLNYLGVAIGACRHESVEMLLQTITDLGTAPCVSIMGRSEKCDVLNAAFVNGMSAHVDDFDDTHLATVIHPSAPIASAAMSVCEWRGAGGRDLITAFVLGCEATLRIGLSVYPAHYDTGWHITGTTGVFGAAVAGVKLLGLDRSKIVAALGIAGTQTVGLREMFGTMTKPFHPGRAAYNGLLAALLAERGFTSSTKVLEAERGFAKVLSSESDLERVTADLGHRWELLANSYKPYPSGVVTHPVIDGVLRLRERHGLTPEQVQSIAVTCHYLVPELTGKREPRTGLEGKFSAYHCSAVGVVDGFVGVNQFTDERVNDPVVVGLRGKVDLIVDPGMQPDEAIVAIRLTDGTEVREHVEHATGSDQNPMSDGALEAKFRDLVEGVLTRECASEILDLVGHLEQQDHLGALIAACTAPWDRR